MDPAAGAMMRGVGALSPGQRANWSVQAVALEVSGLRNPAPPLLRAASTPALRRCPGGDAFGGIVEFLDPLPIVAERGDDGWLGLHLAACFGRTGSDHEARLEWVFDHEDLWRRIARDPLDNLEWAGSGVSDPWSALATAMEFQAYQAIGDGMPSRLPIPLSADDLPSLMSDITPPALGQVPCAVLRARKTGMAIMDDGAGMFATHAANAWALVHFLREAAFLSCAFGSAPATPTTNPEA